jgi:hypothetical protein
LIATAFARTASCQPDAVSFEKVTPANLAPEDDQSVAVWVPVVAVVLKNLNEVTVPSTRGVNRVPSSTLARSEAAATPAGAEAPHMVTLLAASAGEARLALATRVTAAAATAATRDTGRERPLGGEGDISLVPVRIVGNSCGPPSAALPVVSVEHSPFRTTRSGTARWTN